MLRLSTRFRLLMLLLPMLAACNRPQPTPVPNPTAMKQFGERLSGGYPSPEALVDAALRALHQRDTTALIRLAITQQEFNGSIYPEMGRHYPAARDTSQQAREFVWEHQYLSSTKAMLKGMRATGGMPLQLVSIRHDERKDFGSYQLLENPVVRVRAEGVEKELTMFGAIVAMRGTYKLLCYREPDAD